MAVYFIQGESEYVKIGVSDNPRKRLDQLRTGSPYELNLLLEIPGDAALEAQLHAKFDAHRVRGEWFRQCEEILTFIKEHSNGEPVTKRERQEPRPIVRPERRQPKVEMQPAIFGGCIICNRPSRGHDLCNGCADSLAAWFHDPKFPENNPHALWKGAHGAHDTYDCVLGPETWPYDPELIEFLKEKMYCVLEGKKPSRGAYLTLPLPASIRLAGPYVLRALTDEKVLKAYVGEDGFYFGVTR